MNELINEIIHGRDAKITVQRNGQIIEIGNATKFTATIKINTEKKGYIGNRANITLPAGWEGTGSLTVSYGDDFWRELLSDYIENNILPVFSITCHNVKSQNGQIVNSIKLDNCVLTQLTVGLADESTAQLEEEIPFEFSVYKFIK